MKKVRTHYANLQVAENASQEVIKGAYKFLSQKWHPDKHPEDFERAVRNMKVINAAYEVLSDPVKKREHDAWIQRQRSEQPEVQSSAGTSEKPEADRATSDTPASSEQPSFLKRVLLMLLFVLAAVMLLGALPYQIFFGEWKWGYLGGVALWLWFGRYAYMSLFQPDVIREEKRQEEQRRSSLQPSTLKGSLAGAGAGLVLFIIFSTVTVIGGPKPHLDFDFYIFFFGLSVVSGAIVGAWGLRR